MPDSNEIFQTYWHLLVLVTVILGLLLYFCLYFLWPSRKLGKNLKTAIDAIKQLKKDLGGANLVDIEEIGKQVATNGKLAHCWAEFKDSLHPQMAADDMGQERPVCWRATVPAELFFNAETLVAVELKTEYFKHQPGILTGVGIIGTFIGLLNGLSNFSVSSDPEKVRVSLDTLIGGVQEAF
jgi:hypothetical protein